jgi:anti-anti-sigma factor
MSSLDGLTGQHRGSVNRDPRGTVDLQCDHERCLITLAGQFDIDNSELIVEGFLRAMREPATAVELDLSMVTLLSSAAVSSLLQGTALGDERHRTTTLVAASPMVERVLDTLGLLRFFEPQH